MKILIGADLVPTQSNWKLFGSGEVEQLVGKELLQLLQSADYRIFNLEVPLTDTSTPIDKCGPALIAPISTITGCKALGVDCFTIANNHIMDQGAQGLYSTLKVLDAHEISHVGGGTNLAEALKPLIFEVEGKKIGIYACAEHEFSIAEENVPGANPFDPLESPDHVAALKGQCDYVIVLYHGGKEHYRYPSPNLQKVCRKLVEKGADLVVCQHSHCVGCEEKYLNGMIVYGQGNFLFDYGTNEYWQTSLLVAVSEDLSVSYIPLRKHENVVRLATEEDAYQIMQSFYARSEEIKQSGFVEKKYREFADEMVTNYLFGMSGMRKSLLFRICNKLTGYRLAKWLVHKKYTKTKKLILRNFVECEAHRELMLMGMKEL